MRPIIFFIIFSIFCVCSFAQSEEMDKSEPVAGTVLFKSALTYKMLEPNQNLRKLNILLDAKKDGVLQDRSLYLGASFIGIMDYQKSNTEDKFGYLMRHPTANNQKTQEVSEAVVHSASFSVGGSLNSWLSVYSELLYDPEQSFGAGTNTALTRNQIQLRKGFIMVGDLNKSPLYMALGKMDGNFGQQGSVNPFTNSTMWHAFGTLAYGATFGYDKGGLNASVMLIQGGAQFRGANAPVEGTAVPSKLNNYGLDINYTLRSGDKKHIKIGGSYQKGTAYCQEFPIQHFLPCEETNGAFAYYATAGWNNLTLMGSYAITENPWPGSRNPNAPLDVFEAAKVSSLDLGVKYGFNSTGDTKYFLSGEFSNFVAGDDGAPWERQNQIVLGLAAEINASSRLFAEVFRTMGYSPLNFISGGNFDDPGVTHSDKDARSTGIVVGGLLSL
jgi:hypothetical protein